MDTVGLRDLKNNLSQHLRRVRQGRRLVITDQGRSIAVISPAPTTDSPPDSQWLWQLVADGKVVWNGGKPRGSPDPPALKRGPSLSDIVLEDRR